MRKFTLALTSLLAAGSLSAQTFTKNITTATVHPNPALINFAQDSYVFGAPSLDPVFSFQLNRFLFYKQKGAFRAGNASTGVWNPVNMGFYSLATGTDTEATGFASFAVGANSRATAGTAIAMGNSEAIGEYSTSTGVSKAEGAYAFSTGRET